MPQSTTLPRVFIIKFEIPGARTFLVKLDLRFSRRSVWRVIHFGTWPRTVWQKITDVYRILLPPCWLLTWPSLQTITSLPSSLNSYLTERNHISEDCILFFSDETVQNNFKLKVQPSLCKFKHKCKKQRKKRGLLGCKTAPTGFISPPGQTEFHLIACVC
jgi:hypothetical protein